MGKTTWNDVHDPKKANRLRHKVYDVVARRGYVGRGKTTVTIKCPFCQSDVTAYVWSISANGKRCGCGALFDAYLNAYRLEG